MKAPDWSPAEDAVIREHHARRRGEVKRRVDWTTLLALLPGRKRSSIEKRAGAIDALAHPPHWHPMEDAALRDGWGDVGWRVLRHRLREARAKALGLDIEAVPARSRRAIYAHAGSLGLPTGVPQGLVTIAEACRVLGFDHRVLMGILRRQNVQVVLHPTARGSQHTKKTNRFSRTTLWRVVDLDEAREAVLAEDGYETVSGAARARGIDRQRLSRALVRAGLIPEKRDGKKSPFRLASSVIDKLIAERPTLVRAAGTTCRDGRAEVPAAPTSTGTSPELERRSA